VAKKQYLKKIPDQSETGPENGNWPKCTIYFETARHKLNGIKWYTLKNSK